MSTKIGGKWVEKSVEQSAQKSVEKIAGTRLGVTLENGRRTAGMKIEQEFWKQNIPK